MPGLDPEMVDWAIAGLQKLQPTAPLPLAEAVRLGKQGAPVGNKNAAKDKPENKPDNIRFEYGTSAAYTLSRLDRDRPDLAAQVRAKELSANTAAIEAGFRQSRFSVPAEDIDAIAAAIVRRLGPDRAISGARRHARVPSRRGGAGQPPGTPRAGKRTCV